MHDAQKKKVYVDEEKKEGLFEAFIFFHLIKINTTFSLSKKL
tara:strand:- start:1020 stop:1145 length:126 start_codon:yes stop_codon:yes gene_type:complete